MNSQTANHSYASHDIGAGTEARLKIFMVSLIRLSLINVNFEFSSSFSFLLISLIFEPKNPHMNITIHTVVKKSKSGKYAH
ncbi:hypothetical protein LINPERPRIM_LOCUS21575 [Linum perenne]